MRVKEATPTSSIVQKSCSPASTHTGRRAGIAAYVRARFKLIMAGMREVQKPIDMSWPQNGSSTYFCTSAASRLSHSQPVTGPSCAALARQFAWNLLKLSLPGTAETPLSPCTRCRAPRTAFKGSTIGAMKFAGGPESRRPSIRGGGAAVPQMQSRAMIVPMECPRSKRGKVGLACLLAAISSARSIAILGTAPSGPQAMRPTPSASEVRPWPRTSCTTTARPSLTKRLARGT
mmetsp:Transcript_74540/g.210810  ORF Transcript_74540/g.210810 Transcript_74540/m.210810 type:complete len:233 (+) Transcript_74540:268-966(+)